MSERLLVATRKGLFDLRRRTGGKWDVAGRHFLGEPVSMLLHDARDGTCYAALDLGHFGVKLHRSDDDGERWHEVTAPSYADIGGDDPPSLKLIWSLEAGASDELWAGTVPGALFKSCDRGESWSLARSLWDDPLRAQWFGGGYDEPGIHSICVDPQDPSRLAIGVSCGGVWRSNDSGESWWVSSRGMIADYLPPAQKDNPAMQDPHRLVQCRASPESFWVQHHNGIFRSTDRCAEWHEIEAAPSSFGFAVAVHPNDPDTAWFVPAISDERRYPVDTRFVVTRTRDGGRHFETLTGGLPAGDAYDLVYRHGLDIDAGGESLAMGSTTGNLWLSENGGEHWAQVSAHLPPIYALRFV